MKEPLPCGRTSLDNGSAPLRLQEPVVRSPLIILAPGRSYSSVVVQMLGCHPDLYAFPELVLFGEETVDDWLALTPADPVFREWRTSGVLRAYAELRFGGQTSAGVERARTHLEGLRGRPTGAILAELLEAVAPRIGVEKSPSTSGSTASLRRVLRSFPGARFLHLVRHPVATCLSLREQFGAGPHGGAPPPERWVPHHVVYVHRTILRFLSGLPGAQWCRVRGEDVLDDPEPALGPVFEWLGVRADADAFEAVSHPERSPFAGFGPPGAAGGNDSRFQADPRLRPPRVPDSLELPADWSVTPLWRDDLRALGRMFGYAV